MADSDFLRESGYASWLVTGGDVPDDWGRDKLTVKKSSELSLKKTKKVQKNSKAEIINICAVNKRGSTSKPIKIYRTDKDVKLPEQFVLRLDSAADLPSGSEALKISNYKLKLIGTHKKAYLEDILKGFRRRVEGDTFILVNLQTENMTPRNNIAVVDDSWMERLWAWADDRGIYEWTLPRDKLGLVNLKTLEFRQGRGNFSRWINYLEELPLEIWQLPNLQYLDLSATRLTELPKEIGQLTNLQELNLRGGLDCFDKWANNLTELPKEIGQLTNLKILNLRENSLTELPLEIGQLTNLQELDLSRNELTELPKEIGQLTNLQELDLSRTKLTELPKEIRQLTNLTKLDLSATQLTELPKEIGQLTNLQELVLSATQLTELPKEIGQLTNLQELILINTPITVLPKEIGQLTNLQELDLSRTKLTELPKEIEQLTNLKYGNWSIKCTL
jgi:hypothetical protein